MPHLEFLNVDLEIISRTKLDALAGEFEKAGFAILYNGKSGLNYLLAMESHCPTRTPDALIRDFYKIIKRLSSPSGRLWQKARRKTFDLGFEVKHSDKRFSFHLKAETIELIAAVGAGFAITYYPDSEEKFASE